MKIKYMANDGKVFDSIKEAGRRDVCCELEECLRRELRDKDVKHLEEFIQDKKRVNAVIMGILRAVEEIEKTKIEEDEIPF